MTEKVRRRDVVCASAAALPISALAPLSAEGPGEQATTRKVELVSKGQDREGKLRNVGVSVTSFKVCARDTGGALFVMENVISQKGGPPLHLHHNEDEYFYVVEGEFVIEIGGQRFELKPGDSILGPREIPHAYAFVGSSPGRLLLSYAPANKMEEYFASRGEGGRYSSDAERFRAYGMELLGPPIRSDRPGSWVIVIFIHKGGGCWRSLARAIKLTFCIRARFVQVCSSLMSRR